MRHYQIGLYDTGKKLTETACFLSLKAAMPSVRAWVSYDQMRIFSHHRLWNGEHHYETLSGQVPQRYGLIRRRRHE